VLPWVLDGQSGVPVSFPAALEPPIEPSSARCGGDPRFGKIRYRCVPTCLRDAARTRFLAKPIAGSPRLARRRSSRSPSWPL